MTQAPSTPPIVARAPRAPNDFSYDWANQFTRWVEGFVRQQTGFLFLRGSGLFMPTIASSGAGLPVGSVFSNKGVLTIVRDDGMYFEGVSATASFGSVTVTV